MPEEQTITYVLWRDASYHADEKPVDDIDLVNLHEIGFLITEDEEKLVLSIEQEQFSDDADVPQDRHRTVRMSMAIPKVNIIETRSVKLSDLLRWLQRRDKRR
jgi:hypothetical protein